MTDISIVAIKILLLLLPGYLTLSIKEVLSERKSRTEFEKLSIILLFDVIIITLYIGIAAIFSKLKPFIIYFRESDINVVGATAANAFIIFLLAIFIGFVLALFNNYGWGYTICRKLRLTYKSGKTSVWNDVFYKIRGFWVIVHCGDGSRIFGWTEYYSVDPEDKYLFVSDAKYLGLSKDKDVPIKGPGILITPEAKIKYVEFLGNK